MLKCVLSLARESLLLPSVVWQLTQILDHIDGCGEREEGSSYKVAGYTLHSRNLLPFQGAWGRGHFSSVRLGFPIVCWYKRLLEVLWLHPQVKTWVYGILDIGVFPHIQEVVDTAHRRRENTLVTLAVCSCADISHRWPGLGSSSEPLQ